MVSGSASCQALDVVQGKQPHPGIEVTREVRGEHPDSQRHQHILQENGPETGLITGINHLVLFTRDMDEGVRFYRDALGLRVVRTVRFNTSADGLRTAANHSSGGAAQDADGPSDITVDVTGRQVFFEMGNGELFSLYEALTVTAKPAAPVSSVLWPSIKSEVCSCPSEPQKLDHISFDVPHHADLVWFREHLIAHGVAVPDISERRDANNTHRFISSFYFFDPSGNPLEIASLDTSDEARKTYDFSDCSMDEHPVPALVDDSSSDAAPLASHWVNPPTQ